MTKSSYYIYITDLKQWIGLNVPHDDVSNLTIDMTKQFKGHMPSAGVSLEVCMLDCAKYQSQVEGYPSSCICDYFLPPVYLEHYTYTAITEQ